jgi:hypothetical protein
MPVEVMGATDARAMRMNACTARRRRTARARSIE